MPVLRRATDHLRHNRASTTPPSTTKTTKGRSMIRAPYITNDTRSRRLYRLRTNHHTLIKLSMWKKLMTSRKYRASRPHVGKADPALSLTGTCNGSVRSYPRQAHSPNPHSNKRPTKPNPAISRLSASPTPGNIPRHPNLARGVRETYTNADLRCTSTLTAPSPRQTDHPSSPKAACRPTPSSRARLSPSPSPPPSD
jgi:hypothetical protein